MTVQADREARLAEARREEQHLCRIGRYGSAKVVRDLAAELRAVTARAETAEKRLRHSEFHRSHNRRSMRERGRTIIRLMRRIEGQREALRAQQAKSSPLEREAAAYWQEQLEAVTAENERLRGALEWYGRHQPGCSYHYDIDGVQTNLRCSCGYHAALAAAADRKEQAE